MRLFNELWNDETGVVLSAEAVVVGTVLVAGVGAGLNVVASAVDGELRDFGYAVRSLDQSYSVPQRKGCCGAWTAGSKFIQQSVEESLSELKDVERKVDRAIKDQVLRLKEKVEQQKESQPEDPERPQQVSMVPVQP